MALGNTEDVVENRQHLCDDGSPPFSLSLSPSPFLPLSLSLSPSPSPSPSRSSPRFNYPGSPQVLVLMLVKPLVFVYTETFALPSTDGELCLYVLHC